MNVWCQSPFALIAKGYPIVTRGFDGLIAPICAINSA
jgi:hypothetical protein